MAYTLIALIAAAVVLFNRPVTIGVVLWTVILALVACCSWSCSVAGRSREEAEAAWNAPRTTRMPPSASDTAVTTPTEPLVDVVVLDRRLDDGPSLRVRPILHVAPTDGRRPG